MSEYLGKDVIVDIYRLRETLPDFMQNRSGARGIIVRHEDKIIGAYIDAGRHSSLAMACLSRDTIVRYLSMNMNNNDLYNREEDIETNNIKSAKLVKMEKTKASIDKNDFMEYNVTISMKFVKFMVENDGDVFRIITLKKEGSKGAWKITSMATG